MLTRQVHLKNVLFVTIDIFLKKDLNFNHLSVSNDVLMRSFGINNITILNN